MIINKSKFKKLALELAQKRAHKFTRVGNEVVEKANHQLTVWLLSYISSLPSKGKTIK
jgi:hypothetical protein